MPKSTKEGGWINLDKKNKPGGGLSRLFREGGRICLAGVAEIEALIDYKYNY